jgi:hypothetical protein
MVGIGLRGAFGDKIGKGTAGRSGVSMEHEIGFLQGRNGQESLATQSRDSQRITRRCTVLTKNADWWSGPEVELADDEINRLFAGISRDEEWVDLTQI